MSGWPANEYFFNWPLQIYVTRVTRFVNAGYVIPAKSTKYALSTKASGLPLGFCQGTWRIGWMPRLPPHRRTRSGDTPIPKEFGFHETGSSKRKETVPGAPLEFRYPSKTR